MAMCQYKLVNYNSIYPGECGVPVIQPSLPSSISRIVGGSEAIPHSWPWMAMLTTSSSGTSRQFCGGSIVSDRYIITAAHCVSGYVNLINLVL